MPVTFIGDVHGWSERLDEVLAQAEGQIVLMGDVIDRGPAVPAVLDRVHDLCERGLATCLMGNHEWMLSRCLGRKGIEPDSEAFDAWAAYWGGAAVLQAYGVSTPDALRSALGSHVPWLESLPWVAEGVSDNRQWIAVHAGLSVQVPYAEQVRDLQAGWNGSWSTTEDPRPEPLFNKQLVRTVPADLPADRCLVSGHTPLYQPFISARRIGCDTTGGQSGRQLSGVIFPACRIIQSRA